MGIGFIRIFIIVEGLLFRFDNLFIKMIIFIGFSSCRIRISDVSCIHNLEQNSSLVRVCRKNLKIS